jgi:integrase
LRALCELYYKSPEFKRLGQRTRYIRRALLESICLSTIANGAARGDLPYRAMEARHVLEIRNAWFDNGPEAANSRLKALRQVFAWAIGATHADRNPARDVPYLRGNPNGFHTWTVEEVRQYETRHPIGSKARLALALLQMTGVRRSDVVRLGRQMIRPASPGVLPQGPWLHFTETKGEGRALKERAIPILPQLNAIIEATPSGHMTFLVTAFGKPFTANGFGNRFREWCNEAGLMHCSAHGLRKAGATIAAENGATEHQLMAIYGWESPKQAALYTRKARRRKLTGDAMHLIVPAAENHDADAVAGEQAGNKTFPLSAGDAREWERSGK